MAQARRAGGRPTLAERLAAVQAALQLEFAASKTHLPQVMPDQFTPLPTLLDDYLVRHPDERDVAARFRGFLASAPDVFERSHAVGHFTGSAWLVSADGARVLLTHHRKLGRWLQLGGHADGDRDLARVALREAEEESGLTGLTVEPAIFDLDAHSIAAYVPVASPDGPAAPSGVAPGDPRPARGNEPEHWHYDVRFVVRATGSEAFAVSAESLALAWQPIRALADGADSDVSLRRMARKWLQHESSLT